MIYLFSQNQMQCGMHLFLEPNPEFCLHLHLVLLPFFLGGEGKGRECFHTQAYSGIIPGEPQGDHIGCLELNCVQGRCPTCCTIFLASPFKSWIIRGSGRGGVRSQCLLLCFVFRGRDESRCSGMFARQEHTTKLYHLFHRNTSLMLIY